MTGPEDQKVCVGAATAFSKRICNIQAFAESEKEAERLARVVEALEENR